MIRLLIVEDSRVVSDYLEYIFSQDPEIKVIGNVSNGKAALEFIEKDKPDVITMDIEMPIMDGLEATRIIMSTTPVPILIVTASHNANEIKTSIKALAVGALSVIEKPVGLNHPGSEALTRRMVNMVKLLSDVPLVTRKPQKPAVKPKVTQPYERNLPKLVKIPEIVGIGVSSGGPNTLIEVLSKITERFPVPIVIVQHIAPGFINGLIGWLQTNTSIPIHVAIDNETLLPGNVYFAPDKKYMSITRQRQVNLKTCTIPNGICPSVAHLFESLVSFGPDAISIMLTGMGSDGCNEMKLMREAGALTIAQDKTSALIYGMPKVAIDIGAASYALSAVDIAQLLHDIECKKSDA